MVHFLLLIYWGYIMLSNFYKILPYFIVEFLAKKYCEKFETRDGFVSVNVFKDKVIVCRQ